MHKRDLNKKEILLKYKGQNDIEYLQDPLFDVALKFENTTKIGLIKVNEC
jgi:hypothetical protein